MTREDFEKYKELDRIFQVEAKIAFLWYYKEIEGIASDISDFEFEWYGDNTIYFNDSDYYGEGETWSIDVELIFMTSDEREQYKQDELLRREKERKRQEKIKRAEKERRKKEQEEREYNDYLRLKEKFESLSKEILDSDKEVVE